MSSFEQQKLIEDEVKNKIELYLPQPEQRTAVQVEEVDCHEMNIILPDHANSLLFLTLNRSSQQLSTIPKKYDTTLAEHIRDVKEQMKNQYFVMSPYPCLRSLDRKALISVGDNGLVEKIKYKNQSCNSWTCPNCAPLKAKAIGHMISDVANINNLIYYLTITLDPNKLTPEDIFGSTHKVITKLFNHFLTIIRRKSFTYFNIRKNRYYKFDLKNSGKVLKYVWVIEFTENGLAHMHALFNQFLPVEVLRSVWTHVGGGNQMKIEKAISTQAVTKYIVKYILKDFSGKNPNPRTFRYFERRYSVSLSCEKPPKYSQAMFDKNMTDFDVRMRLKELNLSFVYDKLGESQNFPNFEK